MSRRGTRALVALLGAGAVLRLVLAFATEGAAFDIESFRIVRDALGDDPLGVYEAVNQGFARWPYPPGFFLWIRVSDGLAGVTGLPFHGLIQLPAIAADVTLAWLVQAMLGRRGASEGTRLAAAALVALGPSFAMTSGYHGQIDSLAILAAVAALAVWERDGPRRALLAGLLIGAGATVKTIPLVMVLALLPSVRSRREAAVLVAVPAAMLLVALAPFLAADPEGTVTSLDNRGFPGLGGISLIVQPELARAAIEGIPADGWTRVTEFLMDRGGVIVAAMLAALGAFLLRHRPEPLRAAVFLWLGLYALGLNFALQYAVWGLPFLLLQRRLGTVAALQLLLLPAALLFYLAPWDGRGWWIAYCVLMTAAWAAFVALFVREGRLVRVATPAPR